MDDSPLIRLPPEIRNLIYEYTLTHWQAFEFSLTPHRNGHRRQLRPSWWAGTPVRCLALSATCKQTREESRAMFFALNDFKIRTVLPQEITPCLRTFRADIMRMPLDRKVRSVTVVLNSFEMPHRSDDSDLFVKGLLDSVRALRSSQSSDCVADKLGLDFAVLYEDPPAMVQVLRMNFDMADLAGSWRAMIASIDAESTRRLPWQKELRNLKQRMEREQGNFEHEVGVDASQSA